MSVHDSRSPAALSNERPFSRFYRGVPPRPAGKAVGGPPLLAARLLADARFARLKARSATRDEAPKAPSRGSPSGAGGEFAVGAWPQDRLGGVARKEEAARLLTISKSRVASENTEGVRESRSVI